MALNHLSLLRPLLCQPLLRHVRSPLTSCISSRPFLGPDNIQHPASAAVCIRLYATKKAKAKAKGQSAKVNINSALVEDIISLDEVKEDMTAVLDSLKDDFTRNLSIRTSPGTAATRALRESGMNLNPEVDGMIIKVPVPKVTREHRENLAKVAKQLSNKAKDSVRRVRSNAVTQVKKAKEGHSEDTIRLVEKQIQQMADSTATDIDKQLAAKTKELLG
uniref:Ribosome-recycling factor, mitochondrial n=1 Tax=Amphilophus citrinellus TaxID=61819 RepID=A0A3Q0RBW6_AMPCI